jgi:hypothetical protein
LRSTVWWRRLGLNNLVVITTSAAPAITHRLRRSNRFPPVAGVGSAQRAELARPNR